MRVFLILALVAGTAGPPSQAQDGAVPARARQALHTALRLAQAGRFDSAQQILEEATASVDSVAGPDSPEAAGLFVIRANLYVSASDTAAARPLLDRALRIYEGTSLPDTALVATARYQRGMLYVRQENYAAARPLLEQALPFFERHFGPDHPHVTTARAALAGRPTPVAQGDPSPADSRATRIDSLTSRVAASNEARRYAEAIAPAREASAALDDLFGPDHRSAINGRNTVATILARLGEFAEARTLYERVLADYERTLGPADPHVAQTLMNLASAEASAGDFAAARPHVERALALREAALGPDHADVGVALGSLSVILVRVGDLTAARPLMERALAITERAVGPDHPGVAEVLANLGDLLAKQGDPAAAQPVLERAIAIFERVGGPDDSHLPTTLTLLADVRRDRGDDQASLPLYERALAIAERTHGLDHPNVAAALRNLAEALFRAGDPARAREILRRVLTMVEHQHGVDSPEVVPDLEALAMATLLTAGVGDGAAAQAHLERALSIRERALGPDHADVARSLTTLAHVLVGQGDVVTARTHLERALAIQGRALPPDHLDTAKTLFTLGVALERLGDFDQAANAFRRSLATRMTAYGPDHDDVAQTLNGLASVLTRQSDHAAARQLRERAVAILERVLGPTDPGLAQFLVDLSQNVMMLGDLAEARTLLERARSLLQPVLGSDNAFVARVTGNLAHILLLQGDYAAAQPVFEWTLSVAEQAFGPDHFDVASGLNGLGMLRSAQGDPTGAVSYYERAAQIYDRFAERVLPTLSAAEQQALVSSDRIRNETGILLSAYDGRADLDRAYALLGGWKGALLHGLRRQALLGALADDPAHAADVARLQALRGEIARAYPAGGPALDALTDEKETLERALAGALAPGALADPWRDAREEWPGALPAGAALVDVYRYERWALGRPTGARYAAVVSGQAARAPALVDLGPADSLDAAVAAWRARRRRAGPATAALAGAVWGPVAAALPAGTTRVWVSPDGDLARVPWAALAEAHGAEAGDSGVLVAQVPSARALLVALTRPTAAESGTVLAVGGVDFGAAPEEGTAPWAALPGTAAEVGDVARLARGSGLAARTLTGAQATPEAVAAAMPGTAYIHLATHGFFGGQSRAEADARDARSARGIDVAGEAGGPTGPVGRSPLAESGLALAGANTGPAEGRLTAEELVGLDLSAARLVVLSACDTGRGAEVTGQGVLGLQAAVGAAGARSLLMSLWPVPDAATAALMAAFYRGLWADGLGPAEALRNAQAEVRSAPGWSAPEFWAAWVLVGDAF